MDGLRAGSDPDDPQPVPEEILKLFQVQSPPRMTASALAAPTVHHAPLTAVLLHQPPLAPAPAASTCTTSPRPRASFTTRCRPLLFLASSPPHHAAATDAQPHQPLQQQRQPVPAAFRQSWPRPGEGPSPHSAESISDTVPRLCSTLCITNSSIPFNNILSPPHCLFHKTIVLCPIHPLKLEPGKMLWTVRGKTERQRTLRVEKQKWTN